MTVDEAVESALVSAARSYLESPSEDARERLVRAAVYPTGRRDLPEEANELGQLLKSILAGDRVNDDIESVLTEVAWYDIKLRPTGRAKVDLAPPAPAAPDEEAVIDQQPADAEPEDTAAVRAAILEARLLSVEELKALPPPEPLVDGILNRRKLAFLWGKPGGGKSFVALDWALSIATGCWWFGRPVTQGLVLYVAAEGADGIGIRVDAWQNDRRIYDVPKTQFELLPGAVNMLDAEWAEAVVRLTAKHRPVLVVADTLARSMPGGDENGSRDAGIVVDVANRIQLACEATVLFVHHDTREGSNLRGHSSFDGAADTSIECKKDGQNITLKSRKQKDMADFEDIRLWREPVGESCVLWSRDRVGVNAVGATDGERALLAVARECCGSDGLAPSKLQDVAEMPNSSFYRNLKNLLSGGALVNVGTEARPRYRVADEVEA